MQIQLPSPQEIYDLSTEHLLKLKAQILLQIRDFKPKIPHQYQDEQHQSLYQLIQSIELQIQQRKTIEFFTQLCINDVANKYVKEITDFNNEFKKLANQLLINQQQNRKKQQENNFLQNQKKSQNDNPKSSQFYPKSEENLSLTSITFDQPHKENYLETQTSDSNKSQTASEINKMGHTTITKKMGLGQTANMKKNKNTIQEFIKATLAKSKPVEYVSTKGGNLKKSPDKISLNTQNLSISQVSATTPLPAKPIKPLPQGLDTESHKIEKKQNQTSNKSIPSQKSINHKNRESLIKKRNETIQKVKKMKKIQNSSSNQNHQSQPAKKKLAKGFDGKLLVQMVKREEDIKKKKQQQKIQEKARPKHSIQSQKTLKNQLIEHTKQTLEQISDSEFTDQLNQQPKQNQFPIKEQINPISSDTESEPDSVKLSNNNKNDQKNILNKQTKSKQSDQYSPILEQEIEESIAFKEQPKIVKQNCQTDSQPKQNQLPDSHTSCSNHNNLFTKINQTHSSKSLQGPQTKVIKESQAFGKITEEQYNPDGYGPQLLNANKNEEIDNKNVSQSSSQQEQTGNIKEVSKSQPIGNSLAFQKLKKQKHQKSIKNLKAKANKQILEEQNISSSLNKFQNSKIYNQEYWLHIKEEAQAKIQRVKQEKEIQKKERELKAKLIQQESKRIKAQLQSKKEIARPCQASDQENQCVKLHLVEPNSLMNQEDSSLPLQDDENDRFIQQQKENLKKIYLDKSIKGPTLKKPQTTSLIKPPKPSYPRPEFNYLQIYPTFNHIFNVYYIKPESQALVDIPLVMKQLMEMFQSHLDFQKSRKNNFRPSIFLPFDNRKSNISGFNDARQLIQGAETTYVNLKALIERVEIFNSNIQGQFQNCSDEERLTTQFYRVVKTKQEVYDIITTSFLRRKGWKQLPHGQSLKANWNLFWSWSKPQIDMSKLITFQRINHYPFNKNLSRKDLLYKNIDSFRKTQKIGFPYLPLTFNLPKQFTQFSKKFHEEELINREKNYWIMKPIGKSRGRGIKLINSLGDLNYLDNIVVQKYISNPLLLDGYKFDMRIYVLVTSFHPLQAFVYRQGFARFSTEKYSLEPNAMKNNFVHLTNFAINRLNEDASSQFSQGSKISLKSLKEKITKIGYSFASVWTQIHQIIIKSLLACSVTVPPFPAAFELFGYDIMLDDTGQCYLIEINASPSLERSYMIDQIIKQSLIDDIIEIVNPPAFSKQEAINVMNERLSPNFRNNKKGQRSANSDEEDLIHLARILKYQKLRKYGQMPEKIGLFEMVAPSPVSRDLQKNIKGKSGINAPHNID